jgi:DNA-binding beta-propeller fold protein YncE
VNYFRLQCAYLLLLATYHVTTYSQTNIAHNVTATASSFAYPQSVFVDSPNGHIWVTDFDNHRVLRFDVSTLTTAEKTFTSFFPGEYFLAQNYPNPFNPITQISFFVRNTTHASLTVYNLLGQKVATLFNEVAAANTVYSFSFDAKNLPSGIYLYSLRSSNGHEVKRMCLLK